jgi:hypothetical protein
VVRQLEQAPVLLNPVTVALVLRLLFQVHPLLMLAAVVVALMLSGYPALMD